MVKSGPLIRNPYLLLVSCGTKFHGISGLLILENVDEDERTLRCQSRLPDKCVLLISVPFECIPYSVGRNAGRAAGCGYSRVQFRFGAFAACIRRHSVAANRQLGHKQVTFGLN